MKKSLPLFSLLFGTIFLTSTTEAQQPDQFAYAVTDGQQAANWSFLRKLNLQTGEYSAVLLSGDDISLPAYDATSKKQFTSPLVDANYGNAINAPFGTGVAAMAFDKKNNRLYFTPMFIDQLRYLDLKTMKVFYVTDQPFTGMPQKSPDQGNIITRMVIASDGNGYAITNDGMHLTRFTTGKNLKITDLGSLVDDPSNNGVSVHNSCSSFGGDMVADDDGNMYLFSARNHVFKVNVETKIATHLGVISGLPNGFTVNGAAVNEHNQILVGSAIEASSYFTVDSRTLAATPYTIAGRVWHSSDLANGNLLVSGNKPKAINTEVLTNKLPANKGDNKISIYPNPVNNNQFVIQFNQLEAGNYIVQVTDVMGRQSIQQAVSLNGENQAQTIRLNPAAAKGFYLVKVTDQNSKVVFSTKIIVQ
ncbi:MAG: T9SS type A sorting domain-containing protein [Chitinophagaceae bacterium]|nr:T9SS type A sorting domain-containing protein [Chitinophagaceae bacterium]